MEDCSGQLEGLVRKTRDIYLLGVRSDLEQEWLEQQVPQRFSYPLDGGAIQRAVYPWCWKSGMTTRPESPPSGGTTA